MGKSAALRLSDIRAIFELVGDVRDLRAHPELARKRIADGLCQRVHGQHAFTLDLQGLSPRRQVEVKRMVIGGHPEEKGLRYLFESQKENHFKHVDPMTAWA